MQRNELTLEAEMEMKINEAYIMMLNLADRNERLLKQHETEVVEANATIEKVCALFSCSFLLFFL